MICPDTEHRFPNRSDRSPDPSELGASMKSFVIAVLLSGLGNAVTPGQWQPQAIKSDADFRGLCAVSPKVAWVSGTKGTFGRTTDGGKMWAVGTVPGADTLDFRDVEAFGEDTAYLLSAGPGEGSRIYKTTDGGKTWGLQFKNAEPKAFFDAIAFWDEKHGIALSDPVPRRPRGRGNPAVAPRVAVAPQPCIERRSVSPRGGLACLSRKTKPGAVPTARATARWTGQARRRQAVTESSPRRNGFWASLGVP